MNGHGVKFELLFLNSLLFSLPSERSEHWRRLRDWPFCPSFLLCTCWLMIAMTSLHQQHKQQCQLLLSLPPRSGSSFSLPFPCS